MSKLLRFYPALLASLVVLSLIGCGDKKTSEGKKSGDEHAHPSAGPHGGHLIELGDEEYHAELLHDDATDKVTIYMLDSTAKKAVSVAQDAVSINALIDGKPRTFKLKAVSAAGGLASQFELVSEELHEAIENPEETKAKLNVTIDGKPYVGTIEHHEHGDDEKLTWKPPITHEDFEISLGWHGQHIHAGDPKEPLEPAVMITKGGDPVTDAVVFNSLLDKDKTVIVKKVATEHETAGHGEPAHYAQGHLDVPAGTTKAYIRFHIKLPGVAEEFTQDVQIAPHADED